MQYEIMNYTDRQTHKTNKKLWNISLGHGHMNVLNICRKYTRTHTRHASTLSVKRFSSECQYFVCIQFRNKYAELEQVVQLLRVRLAQMWARTPSRSILLPVFFLWHPHHACMYRANVKHTRNNGRAHYSGTHISTCLSAVARMRLLHVRIKTCESPANTHRHAREHTHARIDCCVNQSAHSHTHTHTCVFFYIFTLLLDGENARICIDILLKGVNM